MIIEINGHQHQGVGATRVTAWLGFVRALIDTHQQNVEMSGGRSRLRRRRRHYSVTLPRGLERWRALVEIAQGRVRRELRHGARVLRYDRVRRRDIDLSGAGVRQIVEITYTNSAASQAARHKQC